MLLETSLSLHSVRDMFEMSAEALGSLVDPKNPEMLKKMGGIQGLADSLHTDLHRGLSDSPVLDEIEQLRLEKYLNNTIIDSNKNILELICFFFFFFFKNI